LPSVLKKNKCEQIWKIKRKDQWKKPKWPFTHLDIFDQMMEYATGADVESLSPETNKRQDKLGIEANHIDVGISFSLPP